MHTVTLQIKDEPLLRQLADQLRLDGVPSHLWIEQPENGRPRYPDVVWDRY